MMFKRNKDLMEVFDETWKANHNDDIKKARIREKQFMDKMFDVKTNNELRTKPIGNFQRNFNQMNNNIDYNNQIQRQNRINKLKDRF